MQQRSLFHSISVQYPNSNIQPKYLLWACWKMCERSIFKDSSEYDVPAFLMAEGEDDLMKHSVGIITKLAIQFDATSAPPSNLLRCPTQALRPFNVKYSALYMQTENSSHVGIVVSITDNKIIHVYPQIAGHDDVKEIYNQTLRARMHMGDAEMVVVMSKEKGSRDYIFVNDPSVLSYDHIAMCRGLRNEQYSNLLNSVHEESQRLQKRGGVFARFRVVLRQCEDHDEYIRYAKAVAFIVNQQNI